MPFHVRKNKSICQGKFLIHLIEVARSIYSGIVFQTMHTPQRHVHNLESNWKNYVCIGLRILLISAFLNFTVAFTKILNFPKFAHSFAFEKVNFSLIRLTLIVIHGFWRTLLSCWVLPVNSKSYIQINSKITIIWYFFFFVFILKFFLVLGTAEGWIIQRGHL